MKITMYELLGMVKDGKAPKKIKVTGTIYYFDEEFNFYFTKTKKGNVALGGKLNEINLIYNFNSENTVEILEEKKDNFTGWKMYQDGKEVCSMDCSVEEEHKIPEKLNLDKDELRGKETPRAIDYLIEGKINEVIDYLKNKGDE